MSQVVNFAAEAKSVCPSCQQKIESQAIRNWRPFSCPNCKQIVAPRSAYRRYGIVGCWTVIILCALGSYFLSQRGFLAISIIGFVAGIILAILAAGLIIRVLNRWMPRSPLLMRHMFYVEPRALVEIADFLDTIHTAQEWTSEYDRRLYLLSTSRSLDDALENASLEAAEEFKRRFVQSKTYKKKIDKALKRHNLDELRSELEIIATDLRIAAE